MNLKWRISFFDILYILSLVPRYNDSFIFTTAITGGVFVIVSFLKGYIEGFRVTTLLYWILIFISFFFPFAGTLGNTIAQGILFLLGLLVYFGYPQYKYPKPTGKFQVGFECLNINGIRTSLLYPTLSTKDCPNPPYIPRGFQVWKAQFDTEKLGGGNPSECFSQFETSNIKHIKFEAALGAAPIQADDLPSRQNDARNPFRLPLILSSHGLGEHEHSTALHMKEWASQGYIVLAPFHGDTILPDKPGLDKLDFDFRNGGLKKRVEHMKVVLDWAEKQKDDFFNFPSDVGASRSHDQKVGIDMESVSVIGHSYGGATAAYLSTFEKRITGCCVLMDPWMFPIKKDDYKELGVPLLVARTVDFEKKEAPGNEKMIQEFVSLNKRCADQTLYCYFDESCHASFADDCLFMPREMSQFGVIGKVRDIPKLFENHNSLMNVFLQLVAEKKRSFKVDDIVSGYEQKSNYQELKLNIEKINWSQQKNDIENGNKEKEVEMAAIGNESQIQNIEQENQNK